jgi:hypothetical protein
MANNRFNKQVTPKGYKMGGRVNKMGGGMMKRPMYKDGSPKFKTLLQRYTPEESKELMKDPSRKARIKKLLENRKAKTFKEGGSAKKKKKSKKEHPMKEERFQQTAQERLKKSGFKKSEIGDPRVGTGSKAYNENIMAKGGRVKKMGGGSLKPVDPKTQKGLSKLPTKVRNKMGFMKKGGKVK